MKLVRHITRLFGSRYPEDMTIAALERYAELKGIPDVQSFLNKAKATDYDYDKCPHLKSHIKTNEDWRLLAWCYMVVAYYFIKQNAISVWAIGMGVLRSPDTTASPNYLNEYDRVSSVEFGHDRYLATKCQETCVESIFTRRMTDSTALTELVLNTLSLLSMSTQVPRFIPEDMQPSADGVTSLYYTIDAGKIKFVLHTTERQSPSFLLLRSELARECPSAIKAFLGSDFTMLE